MISDPLRRTLAMTIDAVPDARDDWWIIAGAAVALHGVDPVVVGDVDLLLSVRDAQTLLDRLGIESARDGETTPFQSTVFARWTAPPMTVDIMAGFRVASVAGWVPISPRTRVPIAIDGRVAYIPDRRELAAMLRLFGRPKDAARAAMLEARTDRV